jgi:hypothetical protein
VSSSYASKFPAIAPFLVGGTATLAINNCVYRVASRDFDVSGISRWSSVKLRGKNQRCIWLVTAYRCVKNFHGPLSAWNQQRFILDSCNREEDPIEAFDNDIIFCIKQWIETGDQIILGIDVNEDIRSGTFARWIHLECGLQEITLRNFGPSLPNSYARGSRPIDG